MAAEVVGGVVLNAFLFVLFDKMASRRFTDFFKRQKLNIRLLQELNTAINSVQGVFEDAKEKEITRPAMKKWLDDLKDALFEADDLLDEIAYEATRVELKAESRSAIKKVLNFVSLPTSFEYGLEARLKEILKTLKVLVDQKDVLGLREITGGKQSIHKVPTTSLVERSDIFGREGDLEAIMKLLLSDDVC